MHVLLNFKIIEGNEGSQPGQKEEARCQLQIQKMPEGPQELRSAFARRSSQDVVKPKT